MRQHYWQCEVGLRQAGTVTALVFGTAWHRAMEARAHKKSFEESLAFALPEVGGGLDAYLCQTLAALLLGYWRRWGEGDEIIKHNHPEQKFKLAMPGSPFFTLEGKIDGLCELVDGRTAFVEHKTTSASVDIVSPYWDKLRFNIQVLQYADAGGKLGWDFSIIIYDVVRKPRLKPKEVTVCDHEGVPIIIDQATGQRVFKETAKGRSPRRTADPSKGWIRTTRPETPGEYGQRLESDIAMRPDFYFARREVPVLESDLEEFRIQRSVFARTLLFSRQLSTKLRRPEQAWPRNVGNECKFCSYRSFCLQNDPIDLKNLPQGFAIQEFNPELADDSTNEEAINEPQSDQAG